MPNSRLQVAAAVRVGDPDSLIIVPREWVSTMPFTAGILANCGAGSICSDAAGAVRPPADAGRPSLLDSASVVLQLRHRFVVTMSYAFSAPRHPTHTAWHVLLSAHAYRMLIGA